MSAELRMLEMRPEFDRESRVRARANSITQQQVCQSVATDRRGGRAEREVCVSNVTATEIFCTIILFVCQTKVT